MVERRTVNRGDGGSILPTAISNCFRSPHICLCLSEETLKAGGLILFYLVSMSGKEKDPTQMIIV